MTPPSKRPMTKGRLEDWADRRAEHLFELIRNAVDDQDVVDAIAKDLRTAFGVKTPDELTDGPDFEPIW